MKIVIVGASFAGLACALDLHRNHPELELALYDREPQLGHVPTNFNRRLRGELDDWAEGASALLLEAMAEQLPFYLGYELVGLDPVGRVLTFRHEGGEEEVTYDRLVLALGASQDQQVVSQAAQLYLLSLKTLTESQEAWNKLQAAQSVAVVGAGQMGLECLDALSQAGFSCQLIEARNRPLAKQFDEELTQDMLAALSSRGIRTQFGQAVTRIDWTEAAGLSLSTATATYQADVAILATNLVPNSQLFQGILTLNPDGTVWVDDHLETSQAGIFAVGDLIQLPTAYFGQAYRPMIANAILTGRLAAQNLIGPKRLLPQLPSQVSSKLFGLDLISLGLTQQQASLWEQVLVSHQETADGSQVLKLVARVSDGRLLGAQLQGIASEGLVSSLTTALQEGLSVTNLLSHLPYHQEQENSGLSLCRRTLEDIWRQQEEVAACD